MDKFAFIDVETTGGKASTDRITEIAIRVVQDNTEIESWQSLVDPEKSIPPFVQRLTGISNEMVATAPLFAEIAEEIEAITKGCIFVAHNARFDYAFVKSEFRRLGRSFNRRTLCTVKLAKKLYPQYRRHSMEALIQRHQIQTSTRHRAMADVDAMLAFVKIAEAEHGAAFQQTVDLLLGRPSLPAAISQDLIDSIPEGAGVYRFYGPEQTLLYVGKSVNLRQRVCSHFSSDHSSDKEMTLARSVEHIEWDQTVGELGALLLEIEQIKTLHPVYNRRSRASKDLFTFKLRENSQGYLCCHLERFCGQGDLKQAYGLFRSESAGMRALQKVAGNNELCLKLLGLETGSGSCFSFQTGGCAGACIGKEDREKYNLRMQIAMHALKIPEWPYGGKIVIKETRESEDGEAASAQHKEQFIVADRWCILGRVDSESDFYDLLESSTQNLRFDLDVYLVLKQFLKKSHRNTEILPLDRFRAEQNG